MIDIDEKYKELYQSYGGKQIRLIFYKDEYKELYPQETLFPADDLYPQEMGADKVEFEISGDMVQSESLTITESICSDENLNFGACEGSQVEITISGLDRNIIGKEFLLTESFYDFELILGLYTVESTAKQEDRDTRKIVAYDRMKRFDADVSGWYNALTFPMTLKAFRASLCEFVGVYEYENTVLVNDDLEVTKSIEPTSLKGRDVLQYICQINGVFGTITRSGQMRYIALPETDSIDETITIYQSAESEEYTVPNIDTVKIRQEEGDVGGTSDGDGENVYIVEGNILAYGKSTSEMIALANNIKSVVSNLEYCPAEIYVSGSPWLEVGDRIKVITSDGEINTIIMSRTTTGIQGAIDQFTSTGTNELTQIFDVQSQIIQLQGKSAVLKREVSEVSNHLSDVEAATESKFTQTAETIQAEVTRATTAEGDLSTKITQNATSITAEVKRAKGEESTLSTKITQTASDITAEVTRATTAEGDLSTKITQNATSITSEVTRAKGAEESLSSSITQTAESITLEVNKKVAKGDVTSQLNSELKITGNTIALTTGHFTINADNLTIDSSGNATFSGTVSAATIEGGTLEIGPVAIDDSYANLGDFKISTDGSNQITSKTGYITISQGVGAGSTKYGQIIVTGGGGTTTTINQGMINCGDANLSGISSSYWDDWNLAKIINYIWSDGDYGLKYLGHSVRDIYSQLDELWEEVG